MGTASPRETLGLGPLRGVSYVTLPFAAWDRVPDLHILDFGLELRFDSGPIHLAWDSDGSLGVGRGPLPELFAGTVSLDVSDMTVWRHAVGSPIALSWDHAMSAGCDCDECLIRASFGARDVWIAAGTYLDEDRSFILGGDSVIVMWHEAVVRRLCHPD